MKFPENIQGVADLYPDYLGFIFYKSSKRYVLDENQKRFSDFIFSSALPVQKVGVFVNEEIIGSSKMRATSLKVSILRIKL